MDPRNRSTARSGARRLAQWLSGVGAVGTLTMLGAVALMNGPETFMFFLKRGNLSPLVAIFTLAMAAWLLLRVAGARAARREAR